MKKIFMVLVLAILVSSCSYVSGNLVIDKVKDYGVEDKRAPQGRYEYGFKGTQFSLFTDSLYTVGDTLKVRK